MKSAITLKKYTNNAKFRFLACTLSGILSSVPYFYQDLFFIEWVSYVPLFCIFYTQEKLKRSTIFFYGFLSQFIKTVIVLSMFKELIYLDMFEFSKETTFLLIFLAIICISLIQSLPFGLCAVLSRLLIRYGKFSTLSIIGIPVIYTFTELLKTLIEKTNLLGFLGFPWVMTYITQVEFLQAIQISSVFGAHFVTILVLAVNILIAYALAKGTFKTPFTLALVLIASNCIYGSFALMNQEKGAEISAIAYQDNHSSYDKWRNSSVDVCDEFIEDMEEYFSTNSVPDIILLSETVFPVTFDSNMSKCGKNAKYIMQELADFTKRHGTTLVCGAFSKDENGKYNTLFMFENGKVHKTKYDKRSLVPFGEYIPHEKIISSVPVLSELNLSGSSLSRGHLPTVFKAENFDFGALVCYDSIFYYNSLESALNGAQAMLLSTNDSWYNDSAAIKQHFAQSIFRSVETGRSTIRCATTGISGIIDAHGRVLIKSDMQQKQIVSGTCFADNSITLFCRFGYSYLYILFMATLIYALFCYKKQDLR